MADEQFVTVAKAFRAPQDGKVREFKPGDLVPMRVFREQWPGRSQRSMVNTGFVRVHLPPEILTKRSRRSRKG